MFSSYYSIIIIIIIIIIYDYSTYNVTLRRIHATNVAVENNKYVGYSKINLQLVG